MISERSTEDLVRLVGELTRALIWSWAAEPGLIVVNQTFIESMGEIPRDFSDALAWWKERVHPDDRQRIETVFGTALAGGESSVSCEYNILDRTGVYRVIDDRVTIRRDENGRPGAE